MLIIVYFANLIGKIKKKDTLVHFKLFKYYFSNIYIYIYLLDDFEGAGNDLLKHISRDMKSL